MDYNPSGSSVHGILQARIPECVAIPSPGDLPNPWIEPGYPTLQADSLLFKPPGNILWYIIMENNTKNNKYMYYSITLLYRKIKTTLYINYTSIK